MPPVRACTIDDLFRQDLKVLTVVGVLIAQDADRAQASHGGDR